MKSILLMFSVIALIAGANLLWRDFSANTSPILRAPELIELGVRGRGTISLVKIVIENSGGKTLELTRIRASCGCLTMMADDGSDINHQTRFHIEPNSSRSFTARFSIAELPSRKFRGIVQFSTNDPRNAEWKMEILATVEGHLTAFPAECLFMNCQPGEPLVREFVLIQSGVSQGVGPLRAKSSDPERVIIERKSISVSDPPPEGVPGTVVDRFSVCVASPPSPGTYTASVHVFAEGEEQPALTIPVRVTVVPTIVVSPSLVSLPRIARGQETFQSRCMCRHSRGESIRLEIVECPSELSVELDREATALAQLFTISWNPELASSSETNIAKMVRLRAHFEGGSSEFVIPVKCIRREKGALSQ